MVGMLLWGHRVNKDIVFEDQHKLIKVGFEYHIHGIYEYCQGISEAKGNHHKLIVSIPGTEGSLGCIFIFDLELVAPRTMVYFRKSSRASQQVKKVICPGQKVTVLGRYFVQLSIVYAQPSSSILLSYKQQQGSPQ